MNKPITLVGRHINTRFGLDTAAWYGAQTGAKAIQIFVGSSRSYKRPILNQKRTDLLLALKKSAAELDVKVVVHASLLLNFCRDPDSDIWKKSLACLQYDLEAATLAGAIGVVIHMGCAIKLDFFEALDNYLGGIKAALKSIPGDSSMKLILETGADEGSEICSMVSELGLLYKLLTKAEQAKIGFCIDTCHVFAAGYQLSTARQARYFMDMFDEFIGLDKIVLFHINDAKHTCGSRKDRHQDISTGYIWKDTQDGLAYLVGEATRLGCPLILETPAKTIPITVQLAMIRFLTIDMEFKISSSKINRLK
jgi:deoxyribonuclease-4